VTRLLLDTTFLIDRERGDPGIDDLIEDDDDVAVAAITIAELRVGALLADGPHRAARAALVDHVVAEIPVLPCGIETAEAHAELLAAVRAQGRPRGAHDLMIAATARAAGRTVVTAGASAFIDLAGVAVRSH